MLAAQVTADVSLLRAVIDADARRCGFLKETLEKAHLQLSALASLPKDLQTQISAFVQDDATAFLCLQALTTGLKKAVEPSISVLNRLVSHKALPQARVAALIAKLPKIVEQDENDSNLVLKVIQLVVALWNPPAYRIHNEDLSRALGILFKLAAEPRVAMIHQAAEASLRQIFMELYDSAFSPVDASDPASVLEHEHTVLDLCRLMKDLCNITGGQDPVWLPTPLTLSDPGFGYDRLEELLSHPGMSQLIRSSPDLSSVVRDRIFPLLQSALTASLSASTQQHQQPHLSNPATAIKILRSTSQLLGNYHSLSAAGTAAVFDAVLGCLDSNAQGASAAISWQKSLVISSMRVWMNIPEFVVSLASHHSDVLDRISAKLSSFIQNMFSWDTTDFHIQEHHFGPSQTSFDPASLSGTLDSDRQMVKRLRLFPGMKTTTTDVPATLQTHSSIILQALHSILGMVDVVASDLSELSPSTRAAVAKEFASSCWPSLLAAFSLFLSKSRDEAFILLVLRGYQNFCRICSLIELSTPRDAFLTSLCKFAKPHLLSSSPAGVTVGMGVVAELEREGLAGTSRLSKKNVLTMKTLLNVSHSLAPFLGDSAWAIVLDTLHQLFVILSLRRRSRPAETSVPQENASEANRDTNDVAQEQTQSSQTIDPCAATKDDEDMLFNTLESLFSSTKFMEVKGLVTLVQGLIALSRSRLAELVSSTPLKDAAAQHLFPLTKAFQVVASDLGRLSLVWDTLLHHVVSVAATHRNPDVRIFAARRLTELIEQGVSNSAVFEIPFQDRLLEAIEQLVTQSVHPEVRLEAVESLFRVLGSSGPSLASSTWPVVLSVLMAVGLDTSDSALLALGFKSTQLVVADYLPFIPTECLSVVITTVGCYAGKSVADVNINITAVGLLWNIADCLTKEYGRIRSGEPSEAADRLAPHLSTWDSLWYALMQELVVRSDNRRSEIRNAALQTLFGCLYTYGAKYISAACWTALWPNVLLPLIPWLVKHASTASTEASTSSALLVDHTRNSDMKLWNETHVVLLTGLLKTFKTFFDVVVVDTSVLETVSVSLLDHLDELLLPRSSIDLEISVAAVVSLKDFAVALNGCQNVPPLSLDAVNDARSRCWQLWITSARHYRQSEKPISQRLLSSFVDAVTEVYPLIHVSSPTDLHWIISIAAELPLFPLEYVGELVVLQKQSLSVLQSCVDGSLLPEVEKGTICVDAIPHVVAVLLSYLSRIISLKYSCTCYVVPDTPSCRGILSLDNLITGSSVVPKRELPLAERSLGTLLSILALTPDGVCNSTVLLPLFRDVVTVCGEVMLVRHDAHFQRSLALSTTSSDSSRLWFLSQDILRRCSRICLPLLSDIYSKEDTLLLWVLLLDCIEAFILASNSKDPVSIEADAAWISDIQTIMLLASATVDPKLQKRMFSFLLDAADQVDREGVVAAALDSLFHILASTDAQISSAELLPLFLQRASDILSRFVADDLTSGALPLPSSRMHQITLLLNHLLSLRIPPSLWYSRHPVGIVDSSEQRHLFELFPVFCDCITVKERQVQVSLRALFQQIGRVFAGSAPS